MRAWLAGLAAATAAAVGCEAPKEIIPVAPPGLELPVAPPVAEGEGAQALGEQVVQQAQEKQAAARPTKQANSPPTPVGQPTTTASGLTYETLQEGTGAAAQSGQKVTIHYTGTLPDGTVFDSSRERNSPLQTVIGVGAVIGGWDEGVPGMKVGERRKLTIPPDLGYGSRPNGKIPANSTLIFDVELLGVGK